MNERNTRQSVSPTIAQRVIRCTSVVLALAMTLAVARADTPEPDLEAILTHVRDAKGFARLTHLNSGVLLTGTSRHYGTDGTYRLLFNPDGRFVEKTEARLSSTVGFDGREAWSVDWSGLPSLLELEDLERVLATQWVHTGRWLVENGPFAITLNAEETSGEKVVLDLRLRNGVLAWQVTIDRRSWLPTNLLLSSKGGTDTWTFTDYRDFKGVRLACRVDHVDDAGKTDAVEIADIAAAPHSAGNPYERITKRPDDTRFNADAPAELKVKATPTGHLLVHPSVDGRDLGWFIFDTGAGAMVITPSAADAADMPAFGEVTANGVGGMLDTRFRQGKSLTLGRVTIDKPIHVELDLSFLTPFFGVEVAGICGYDLLARVVAEFDPHKRKISLLDPASYALAQGDWQELFIGGRHPHVIAGFEGKHEGVFRLDTGANGTVTFHAPAVKRLGLLEGRDTTSGFHGGAGGMKKVRTGTVEWFELAGHRFEEPVVVFGLSDQGASSGHRSLGTIGLEFLEPFVVVFNYPDKKIAFVKRQ
ncbi:MAG: retropepsin-like domain-containing protein [Phycisphaerales bacterium]|nr:MAG: retropepsin-like domain-containing protein [Phycisphaerales bacterium]